MRFGVIQLGSSWTLTSKGSFTQVRVKANPPLHCVSQTPLNRSRADPDARVQGPASPLCVWASCALLDSSRFSCFLKCWTFLEKFKAHLSILRESSQSVVEKRALGQNKGLEEVSSAAFQHGVCLDVLV